MYRYKTIKAVKWRQLQKKMEIKELSKIGLANNNWKVLETNTMLVISTCALKLSIPKS